MDHSLLTALVEQWRPETHTFHLPYGEMAPTLQDMSYLLGLLLLGEAVGPQVVPPTWMADLEARFAGVDLQPDWVMVEHPQARGLSRQWLETFRVHFFHLLH